MISKINPLAIVALLSSLLAQSAVGSSDQLQYKQDQVYPINSQQIQQIQQVQQIQQQQQQHNANLGHYDFEVAPKMEPPSVRKPPYLQSAQVCPGSGKLDGRTS